MGRMRRSTGWRWGLFLGLGLLAACLPGGEGGRASAPFFWCDRGRPRPERLCFYLEGDPRPGSTFLLIFDAFYDMISPPPSMPPFTLTILLPHTVEVVGVETGRSYRMEAAQGVPMVDPAQLSSEAFSVPGIRIQVDLGWEGQQKLWDPYGTPYGGKEASGERVRVTVRLREPGEWQVRGILSQGESNELASIALLGWSTEAQAYWTDYDTAFMRAWNLKSQQCGGVRPCTIRFPYDPYRFALGVPPEAPGHSLRERPTTFCSSYGRPGTCTDYGLPEVSPEDLQPEESPPPVSPPASSPPSPAAPARWLDLSGRIHYRDPLTGVLLPARGVRVELWNEPEPSPRPCAGQPRPTPRPPRVPPPTPPLACRRARLGVTYTGEDGSYSFSVPTAFPLRLVLRVYARDDRRVAVQDPSRGPYVHKTEPVELSPGVHRLDVVIEDGDNRTAFFIYDTLTRWGWEELMRRVGWAPDRAVDVYWPSACIWWHFGGSCYHGGAIRLVKEDGEKPFVILHEFAHFVLSRFHGDGPIVAACVESLWQHDLKWHTSPSCAWSEGWADFLAIALKGYDPGKDVWIEDPLSFGEFPRGNPWGPWGANGAGTNADSEWAVAAVLWDLYDDAREPWDILADDLNGPGQNGLWAISTQPGFRMADGIFEFWMRWVAGRPGQPGEAACPMYRLEIFLAAHPMVSWIPRGLCPPGWWAEFFQDRDDGQWALNGPITWETFTPPPVARTFWACVAFDTHAAPDQPVVGLSGTFWSARFSGWLLVPVPANPLEPYRFFFDRLDDGGRLVLDGETVWESWIVHGPREEVVERRLPAGLVPVVVEYAQGPADESSLFLDWEGPGWGKEPLCRIRVGGPAPTPTPTPAGWDARISPGGAGGWTPAPRPTGTPRP